MKTHRDCHECGPGHPGAFERNNYFFGKALTVRDFEAEQRYVNEKRWLINRSVLGWGVVCGLKVELEGCWRLTVSPGLALDCHGREVWVPCADTVDLTALREAAESPDTPADARWIVCLRYRECTTEPVRATAPTCGDEDGTEPNRIRETYVIEPVLAEDLCLPETHAWPCPEDLMKPGNCGDRPPSLHEVLCRHAPGECPDCCDCACVPLGTLRLKREEGCDPHPVLDPCEERRLVYSNPLLFRLYSCEHGEPPPRVVEINWGPLHGATTSADDLWKGLPEKVPLENAADPSEYPFRVRFDRLMDSRTIGECSVRMTVVAIDDRTWYRRRYEVPIQVQSFEVPAGDSGCTVVGFCPRGLWLSNEDPRSERNVDSRFRQQKIVVEIELVGSLIRDAQGRLLDGEAPWRDEQGQLIYPSGEGSEGGSFVSCIEVTGFEGPQASAY